MTLPRTNCTGDTSVYFNTFVQEKRKDLPPMFVCAVENALTGKSQVAYCSNEWIKPCETRQQHGAERADGCTPQKIRHWK